MLNFTKKYINNPNSFAGSYNIITVYQHKNGETVVIDFPDMFSDNMKYVGMHFESGKSVSVEVKNKEIRVATNDDFRKRDFSQHSGMDSNPALLTRIYLRHILGRYLSDNELEAIQDAVSEF